MKTVDTCFYSNCKIVVVPVSVFICTRFPLANLLCKANSRTSIILRT